MIIRDLLDLVSKEKRRKERVKTAQKLALGAGIVALAGAFTGALFATKQGKEVREEMKKKAGNTIDTIKEKVQETAETMKNSAAKTSEDFSKAIHDIQGKTKAVKKDVKSGYRSIKKDISKTAEKILDDSNL